MRKWWRWLVGLLLLGCIAAVLGFMVSRPTGPVCEIGPTKHSIRWVPMAATKRKPMIDIGLPGGGRFQYPEPPPLALAAHQNPMTAGYLVFEGSPSFIPQDVSWMPIYVDGNLVIPVRHPSASDKRGKMLIVDGEELTIRRPYDPNSLPARWDGLEFECGPYRFKVQIVMVSTYYDFQVTCINPDFSFGTMETKASGAYTSTGSNEPHYSMVASPQPDGSIAIGGQFTVTISGKEKKYPLKATIRPRKSSP